MAAYHNPDWAEFYDLWILELFGPEPSEDKALFAESLKAILNTYLERDKDGFNNTRKHEIVIIDQGTGTGRCLIDLYDSVFHGSMHMDKRLSPAKAGFRFRFFGMDTAVPMIERGKTKFEEHVSAQPKMNKLDHPRPDLMTDWVEASASSFVADVFARLGSTQEERENGVVDLLLFSVGSICHITEQSEIGAFLHETVRCLKPGGRAIVSILNEFLPTSYLNAHNDTEESKFGPPADGSIDYEKTMRIPSKDRPGEVYVKYPTTEVWESDVRTDRFRLEVQDERGSVLRAHDLDWKIKMLDVEAWKKSIAQVGLRVAGEVRGDIQVWWVLEKWLGKVESN